MRESIGSTFIFTLAITFTLIFAGFLTLAINYNRAYKIKNELTSMIERYEGITGTSKLSDNTETNGSIAIINNYLSNNGYTAKGKCPLNDEGYDVYGVDDLEITQTGGVTSPLSNANINSLKLNETAGDFDKQYHYCLTYIPDKSNCKGYFRVTVFFDFNLPVLGQLTKFNVTGQTNEMYPVYIGNTKVIDKSVCK